jgi:hypothetical protein
MFDLSLGDYLELTSICIAFSYYYCCKKKLEIQILVGNFAKSFEKTLREILARE